MKRHWKIATALAAAITLAPFAAKQLSPQAVSHADTPEPTALVLKVVDGDTIDILDDVRKRLRLRLIGLDTPETKKPGYTIGCFGPEASEFARNTLQGKRVAVVTDPSQETHDRYGRTLAFVILPDGTNYSVAAVKGGYAHAYVFGHKPSIYAPEIAAAEQDARNSGRGLWGPPCFGDTKSVPRQ